MLIICYYFLFLKLTEEKQPTLEGWICISQVSEPPHRVFGCSELDVLDLWAGISWFVRIYSYS